MPTKNDQLEVFGILDLVLPIEDVALDQPEAILAVENQELIGHAPGDGTMRFRFCPKAATTYDFKIQSNVPALDGTSGEITAYSPSPDTVQHPASNLPNWWTDDPDPVFAEGGHHGARTVSRWREDFLQDLAARMEHCVRPASAASTTNSTHR
jgi:hypothetical protein